MNIKGLFDLEVQYEVSDTTVSNDLRLLHQFCDEAKVADLLDKHFKKWLNATYPNEVVEEISLRIVGVRT